MTYEKLDRETITQSGLREGLFITDEDTYYHGIDAISQSRLKEYRKSPAHYKHACSDTGDGPENPIFVEGKAWHLAILEPERFRSSCAFEPKIDKRTKAGKEAYAEWAETCKGKLLIPEDTFRNIETGVAQLRSDKALEPFISDGVSELTVLAREPVDNLWMKGRIDYWKPKQRLLLDLKTTSSLEDFGRSIINYGYLVQAAFYIDLMEMVTKESVAAFGFLAVEKKAPYAYKVFLPSDRAIEHGRQTYRKYLDKHRECVRRGEWPLHENLVEMWEPDEWFFRKGF